MFAELLYVGRMQRRPSGVVGTAFQERLLKYQKE